MRFENSNTEQPPFLVRPAPIAERNRPGSHGFGRGSLPSFGTREGIVRVPTLQEIERRLQALEDERDIRRVLVRYGFNADLGRSEAYAELFTEDGVLDLQPGLIEPSRYVGHDELLTMITGPAHKAIEGHCQHQMEGPPMIVYVDGDSAVAEGYSITYVREEDGTAQVLMNSFNRWTLKRTEGDWKIRECYRRPMGSEGQADVFKRTLS